MLTGYNSGSFSSSHPLPLSCTVDGGIVIIEENSPVKIERFYDGIKVITQSDFVLISSDPSLKGTRGPKPCQ